MPVLAADHDVVAVSRRSAAGRSGAVDSVTADVTSADDVRRALEGVDVAYYLVHSLDSDDFEARDLRAATSVANEAERARLRQLVYLGGLGDDSADLSRHLRSRLETGRLLAGGAVPLTSLNAAMVVGRGSAAFETIVALVNRLPGMVCPRWVATPTQPIALTDVVAYLAGVCGLEQALGRSFDAGGPEVMTYRAMIERVARLKGRRRLIVEVPFLTPRLSSYWLHLVTPVSARVARPLIDGLRNPTVTREDDIRALVPIELTTFDEAVLAALGARTTSSGSAA